MGVSVTSLLWLFIELLLPQTLLCWADEEGMCGSITHRGLKESWSLTSIQGGLCTRGCMRFVQEHYGNGA